LLQVYLEAILTIVPDYSSGGTRFFAPREFLSVDFPLRVKLLFRITRVPPVSGTVLVCTLCER
jgi:hypothetical protein